VPARGLICYQAVDERERSKMMSQPQGLEKRRPANGDRAQADKAEQKEPLRTIRSGTPLSSGIERSACSSLVDDGRASSCTARNRSNMRRQCWIARSRASDSGRPSPAARKGRTSAASTTYLKGGDEYARPIRTGRKSARRRAGEQGREDVHDGLDAAAVALPPARSARSRARRKKGQQERDGEMGSARVAADVGVAIGRH
jgi:hypothetical protein